MQSPVTHQTHTRGQYLRGNTGGRARPFAQSVGHDVRGFGEPLHLRLAVQLAGPFVGTQVDIRRVAEKGAIGDAGHDRRSDDLAGGCGHLRSI